MLIVGKRPALTSVEAGHYFQGKQGQMFWQRLRNSDVLPSPPNGFEDEILLDSGFGLTDIVKVPAPYGVEPSVEEYRLGTDRILGLIEQFSPTVLMFPYKGVLDRVLALAFGDSRKSRYGFNDEHAPRFGSSRPFAFPMPGTPCTQAEAIVAMTELATRSAPELPPKAATYTRTLPPSPMTIRLSR